MFHLCTTSSHWPLDDITPFGMFRLSHTRSLVFRTVLPVISRLTLGQISCSRPCPPVYSCSLWSTSRPPTTFSPPSLVCRFVYLHLRLRFISARLLFSLSLLSRVCLPVSLTVPRDAHVSLHSVNRGLDAMGAEGPSMLIDCTC